MPWQGDVKIHEKSDAHVKLGGKLDARSRSLPYMSWLNKYLVDGEFCQMPDTTRIFFHENSKVLSLLLPVKCCILSQIYTYGYCLNITLYLDSGKKKKKKII